MRQINSLCVNTIIEGERRGQEKLLAESREISNVILILCPVVGIAIAVMSVYYYLYCTQTHLLDTF